MKYLKKTILFFSFIGQYFLSFAQANLPGNNGNYSHVLKYENTINLGSVATTDLPVTLNAIIPAGYGADAFRIRIYTNVGGNYVVKTCANINSYGGTVQTVNSIVLFDSKYGSSSPIGDGTATTANQLIYTMFRTGYTFNAVHIASCNDKANSNLRDFWRNQARLANILIHGSTTSSNRTPITVEVTFGANINLTVFRKFSFWNFNIGSNDLIYTSDRNGYVENSKCATGECNIFNDIRNYNHTNTSFDVRFTAHRGLWGKSSGPQENTIGAIQAAKNAGIKIVELDIMPYGVQDEGAYFNAQSGIPAGLVCFHDFILNRLTSSNLGNDRVYSKGKPYLQGLYMKKPRTDNVGAERLMFFRDAVDEAKRLNMALALDIKNLEINTSLCGGSTNSVLDLCGWNTDARKRQSLIYNLKAAINGLTKDELRFVCFKTYESYDDLQQLLTTGTNAITIDQFYAVLWIPMLAPSPKWANESGNGSYSPDKISNWINDWFFHNKQVVYYETNFLNDWDDKTSTFLKNVFFNYDVERNMNTPVSLLKYIATVSGRRVGIFAEEPVGGRGTVNRWGKWSMKNTYNDKRGDHLWLINIPYMRSAVYNTDRPDVWRRLKEAIIPVQ